jgi:FkbM family methyltransferase
VKTVVQALLKVIPFPMRDRIRTVPGLASAQRALVAMTLDGKIFDHRVDAGPAKGMRFRVHMPEDKGIWTGTYEAAFAARLGAGVKAGRPAFDIGGWHGFFAGVMSAQGASEVHVFEPLPENQSRIRQLIYLNPDRSIKLHSCAVGDDDAEIELVVMPETSMAKLEISTFQSALTSNHRMKVKLRSIDSMVAAGEIPPLPGLIKIDVEGAEVLVLQGAAKTLRTARPEIFIEIHSTDLLRSCEALLGAEGYAIEHLDVDKEVARARDVFQVRAVPAP